MSQAISELSCYVSSHHMMSKTNKEEYGKVFNWRNGQEIYRLETPSGQGRLIFVTINLNMSRTDISAITVEEIIAMFEPLKRQLDQLFSTALFGGMSFYGVLEFGQFLTHPHIHMVIDQGTQKKRFYQIFNAIKNIGYDDIVIQAVYSKDIFEYMTKGIHIVFWRGEANVIQHDEVDGQPVTGDSGGFNLAMYVKEIMDDNPNYSATELCEHFLTHMFHKFKKPLVLEAYENWKSLEHIKLKKAIPYNTDPKGYFQFICWIALQRNNYNSLDSSINKEDAACTIFKFFAKLCRNREGKDEKNLYIVGPPGSGKTWISQWIHSCLDSFSFSLDSKGCGKYEGAVNKKVAVCDEVPKDVRFVQHNDSFSTLLNILGGSKAAIKVFGTTKQNLYPIWTVFLSNYSPAGFCPQLKRRLIAVNVEKPCSSFEITDYSHLLVYNYFRNSLEYIENNKYPCMCACFLPINKICNMYSHPSDMFCRHFHKLMENFPKRKSNDFKSLGGDPWELYNSFNIESDEHVHRSTDNMQYIDNL